MGDLAVLPVLKVDLHLFLEYLFSLSFPLFVTNVLDGMGFFFTVGISFLLGDSDIFGKFLAERRFWIFSKLGFKDK